MADYAPKYLYADQITSAASIAITGGQVVEVTGSGTIGPAAADSAKVVGVAAHDAAIGARVSFHPRGQVHVSTAAAAITAGSPIFAAAAGTVTGTSEEGTQIGIALTTAAQNGLVEWMEC